MLISSTLRGALKAKVPSADFTPYFVFLESCATVGVGERHHILPKKEFSEFVKTAENLIYVSPADHFRAHYWLALCAPQCESFQQAFFLMTNRAKQASWVAESELTQYAKVYERGRALWRKRARANGLKSGAYIPTNKGRKHTEEELVDMQAKARTRANLGLNSTLLGTSMSEVSKKRLSDSQKLRWQRARETGRADSYKFKNQYSDEKKATLEVL